MSNTYLYVAIALVIALVIAVAYLVIMVNNESAKVVALESRYAQLRLEYDELRNSTAVTRMISFYESMVQPVAYVHEGFTIGGIGIFLNITNPTGEPMNMTIGLYPNLSLPGVALPFPIIVMVPPHTTLELPVLIGLYNANHLYYMNYLGATVLPGSFTPNTFTHAKFLVIMLTRNLTYLGLSGITYNATIIKTITTNKPIGFATYALKSTSLYIYIMNPLTLSVAISGYDIYAYNGTLLTSCTLERPITINATSIVYGLFLPTRSEPSQATWFVLLSSSGLRMVRHITLPQITCTVNYQFPISMAQMPYGYVILHTNIGNTTIPLLQAPYWWRIQ